MATRFVKWLFTEDKCGDSPFWLAASAAVMVFFFFWLGGIPSP